MDAPPGKEDVRPLYKVTGLWSPLAFHVPHVHEADIAMACCCSRTSALRNICSASMPATIRIAFTGRAVRLGRDQTQGKDAARELAPYDREPLARELALMPEWFCKRHLEVTLTDAENQIVADTFEFLIAEALMQPEVFVHRDFHSRNLMITTERNPGVIDFQDALRGPIGYDLVSILKDCYIGWPRERVEQWVTGYRNLLRSRGGPGGRDGREFLRWFDLIGMQRPSRCWGYFPACGIATGRRGTCAIYL